MPVVLVWIATLRRTARGSSELQLEAVWDSRLKEVEVESRSKLNFTQKSIVQSLDSGDI
jgi:hypothetical protein